MIMNRMHYLTNMLNDNIKIMKAGNDLSHYFPDVNIRR